MELSILTFALLAFVVVVTPGPTVLLALSNGSRFGFPLAGFGIAGAALSDAVLIAAAGLGLGALLSASVFWFSVVKWVGVAYLVWLGVQMLRSAGKLDLDLHRQPHSPHQGHGLDKTPMRQRISLFRKSFLAAVTNPKGYLFFTAFLPQFITPTQPTLPQYIMLGVVFITVDMVVMAAYAGLGRNAARFLKNRGALWLDRSCGGLLITLGIALAFVRRGET